MPEQPEDQYVALIQQHEGIIHKVINLHIDHAEDRKDLFQEILLQAWKSFPRFEGKSKFSTWLYRVALNTVFTFQRKERDQEQTGLESVAEPTQAAPEKTELHEWLYHLIRQMDEVDRTVMTLHLDGYQHKEIAEILGMTANHVNVKIHRLKKYLIDTLKKVNHGS